MAGEAGSVGHPPAHYAGNGIDNFDVWDDYRLDPYSANAFKYLARWDKKGTPLEDLKKARHYIQETRRRIGRAYWQPMPRLTIEQVVQSFDLMKNLAVADAVILLLRWACDRTNAEYLNDAELSINFAIKKLEEAR